MKMEGGGSKSGKPRPTSGTSEIVLGGSSSGNKVELAVLFYSELWGLVRSDVMITLEGY